MTELERHLTDYFIFFVKTLDYWRLVGTKTSSLLRPLCNQCEQLRLSERVQLDDKFLQLFPTVKEKVLGKIKIGIEEEMRPICQIEEEMKIHVDGLKTRLNSIERAYSKRSPSEELAEFNSLIPPQESLVEYAFDVWKCFHTLWIGFKNSIETVDYLSKKSIDKISDSVMNYTKIEPQLQYIADLTQFLRSKPDGK